MTQISKRRLLLTAAAAGAANLAPRAMASERPLGEPRIMEGPMVGHVTPNSITIWTRMTDEVPLTVEYDTNEGFTAPKRSAPVTARAADDYTVRITLTGLAPATTYHYRMIVEDELDRFQFEMLPGRAKTAPTAGWRGRFTVGLGSCANFGRDPIQPIWNAVNAAKPDLFFWIGDNIYADTLSEHVFVEEYRRQRRVANLEPVIRNIPNLAIWDDHDYGLNDNDRTNPMKDVGLKAFKQYWANPSYGLPETPGVFFTYSYGGTDFFFLDDRYYRSPNSDPMGPEKTMLGAGQLAWLKAQLKASKAPFKVLLSGSGWSLAKGPVGDSWSAFQGERNELFDFIRAEKIEGVVLTSGDTHVAELNCIPWSEKGGYDLYDMTTSPLAQRMETSWMDRRPEIRIRQVFAGDCNFGHMTFDTTNEPTLTYNVYSTLGARAWDPFQLKASELKNGVSSWRAKIDARSLRNHERWKSGGSYYPA